MVAEDDGQLSSRGEEHEDPRRDCSRIPAAVGVLNVRTNVTSGSVRAPETDSGGYYHHGLAILQACGRCSASTDSHAPNYTARDESAAACRGSVPVALSSAPG